MLKIRMIEIIRLGWDFPLLFLLMLIATNFFPSIKVPDNMTQQQEYIFSQFQTLIGELIDSNLERNNN